MSNSKEITYFFDHSILKIIRTQHKGATTHVANPSTTNRVFTAAKFMSTGKTKLSSSGQKSEEVIST